MQRDLVVRAQGGDLDAFSALTAGRTSRLYAVARLILRHDEQAADAVQPRDGEEADDDPLARGEDPEIDQLGVCAPTPRREGQRGRRTDGRLGHCQLVAPLIFGSVIAPSAMPHFFRIEV